MDLSSTRPSDDLHAREPQPPPRSAATHGPKSGRDGGLAPSDSDPQSVRHGGITAPSRAEDGELESGAREQQTKDLHARLQEAATTLAREARLPTNALLSIEVENTDDPAGLAARFLVRHKETGAVLRRIPDDEARGLLAGVEDVQGLVVDRRA